MFFMPCCSFDHLGRIIIKYLLNKKFHETCTGIVLVCIIFVQGIQIQGNVLPHHNLYKNLRISPVFSKKCVIPAGEMVVDVCRFYWCHWVASGATTQLELLE